MNTTTEWPLLLELSQPVKISSRQRDTLTEALEIVRIKYNPQTQVIENVGGDNPYPSNATYGDTIESDENDIPYTQQDIYDDLGRR